MKNINPDHVIRPLFLSRLTTNTKSCSSRAQNDCPSWALLYTMSIGKFISQLQPTLNDWAIFGAVVPPSLLRSRILEVRHWSS